MTRTPADLRSNGWCTGPYLLMRVLIPVLLAGSGASGQFSVLDSTNTPLETNRIISVAALPEDGMLIRTSSTLWRVRDSACELVAELDNGQLYEAPLWVDAGGDAWFGTRGTGLRRISGTTQMTIDSTNSCFEGYTSLVLGFDGNGNVIFSSGTFYGYAICFDAQRYTGANCIPLDPRITRGDKRWVVRYSLDSTGAEWFGTTGNEYLFCCDTIYRSFGGEVVPFDLPSGSGKFLYSEPLGTRISVPAGIAFVANSGEISILDTVAGRALGFIHAMFTDSRGALWLGIGGDSVAHITASDTLWMELPSRDSENYVVSIAEHPNGEIWLATLRRGIAVYTYPSAAGFASAGVRCDAGSAQSRFYDLRGRRLRGGAAGSHGTVLMEWNGTQGKRTVGP